MIDEEGQSGDGHDEELDAKRVVVAIVRRLELDEHEVDGGDADRYEDDLHRCVVERDVVCQQVEVARCEDECKHDLRLARNAYNTSSLSVIFAVFCLGRFCRVWCPAPFWRRPALFKKLK